MDYPVIFTAKARKQLAAIQTYLADRFYPETTEEFVLRLVDMCESLGRTPHMGTLRDKPVPGTRLIGFERRVAIHYILQEGQVLILALRYGGYSEGD